MNTTGWLKGLQITAGGTQISGSCPATGRLDLRIPAGASYASLVKSAAGCVVP